MSFQPDSRPRCLRVFATPERPARHSGVRFPAPRPFADAACADAASVAHTHRRRRTRFPAFAPSARQRPAPSALRFGARAIRFRRSCPAASGSDGPTRAADRDTSAGRNCHPCQSRCRAPYGNATPVRRRSICRATRVVQQWRLERHLSPARADPNPPPGRDCHPCQSRCRAPYGNATPVRCRWICRATRAVQQWWLERRLSPARTDTPNPPPEWRATRHRRLV